MNYRLLSFLFFFNAIVFTQEVPQELQTYLDQLEKDYKASKDKVITYSTDWYQRIDTILISMDGFSKEDQESITNEVLAIKNKMESSLVQTFKNLNDQYKKYKKNIEGVIKQFQEKKVSLQNAKANMNNDLQQQQKQASKFIVALYRTIELQLRQPEITYKSKKREVDIKQLQEKEKKKREYDLKMRKFYMSLAQNFPELEQANNAARQALLKFLQFKKIDSTDTINVTQKYADVLNQFDTAYKENNISVAFDAKTNYLSITLRRLINFYLDDISLTLKIANSVNTELTKKKQDKLPYYAFFYDLSQRIGGTGKGTSLVISKGYDGQIAALADKFFKSKSKIVIQYFVQKKKEMSIDAFGNALWDLSVNVTDPSQTALDYAQGIYKELMSDIALLEETKAQNSAIQAYGYMAGIYLNRAQATLKKMEPKKDNSTLLEIVISSYREASNYFEKAGDAADAQQYKNLVTNLKEGKDNRDQAQQAEKNKNISQAIYFYQEAYKSFSIGGDVVDAQEMDEKANELNAQIKVGEGQSTLHDFITQNQTQLKSYMTYISLPNLEENLQLSTFAGLLSDLSDACDSAITSYKSASNSLEKLGKPYDIINSAVLFLQYLVDGLKHLSEGDTFADLATQENFQKAEYTSYPQALFNAQRADALYSQDSAQYLPIFPSAFATDQLKNTLRKNQQWNFELLFNRHIAKRYIEVAATIEDQLLTIEYFAAADGVRTIYINPAMETMLSTSLEQIIGNTETFQKLIKQATEKQAAALKFTSSDWQQDQKVSHFYLSKADNAWKDVLRNFAMLYRFGKDTKKAGQNFLNAVAAYAKSYQSDVPKEFYPSIGTALIYYHQFIFYMVNEESNNATNALQTISNLAKSFFDNAKDLQKKIENPDLIMSATDNQKKVVEWKNRFEQAVAMQNEIIAELAPKINPQALQLFLLEVDSKTKNITCKMQEPGKVSIESLTIANPELKLADIYKKLGDALFKKADYSSAYVAYYYSQSNYNKIGKINEANQAYDLYKKAFTRSIYHAYLKLVVPNKTYQHNIKMLKIADVSVPQHYELFNDVQVIPTDKISLPQNLSTLANKKTPQQEEQIQTLLLYYAYLTFLDKKLTDNGIAFEKIITSNAKLRSLEEISNEFSKNGKLPLIIRIMESASYYQKKLQERIKNKKSTIHLLQESKKGYILAISYQPLIASIPETSNSFMTQLPYKSYYPAQVYYSAIRTLSDPSKDQVRFAKKIFVSGKEKDIYDQALIDLAKTSLVSAGAYEGRINYLIKGGTIEDVDPTMDYEEMITLTAAQLQIKTLKQVKKDDFSVKLTDYQQPINIIQNYAKVIGNLYNMAYGYYDQKKDSKELENISTALSNFYIRAGDNLQVGLVGNPQAAEYFYGSGTTYGGLIVNIQNLYQLGYAYNKKLLDQAEGKIAAMYEQAGDLVASKKNYFGALPYYKFAVSAYHVMKSPDKKKFAQTGATLLNVYFKGSMEQLMNYRKAMLAPLSLQGKMGAEKISLQDLIKKVQTDPTVTGTERETFNMLHDTLLDATIYFSDCSGWGAIFAYPKGKPEDKDQDPVTTGGKELLSSYTKKNNFSFDTVSSVTKTIIRPDFEKLMNDAFDSFSQKVIKATNDQDRLIGYAAMQQLTNTLYFALGKIYMKFYLSALDPGKQYVQWINAINAEKQNIVAPPDQWLGKE